MNLCCYQQLHLWRLSRLVSALNYGATLLDLYTSLSTVGNDLRVLLLTVDYRTERSLIEFANLLLDCEDYGFCL